MNSNVSVWYEKKEHIPFGDGMFDVVPNNFDYLKVILMYLLVKFDNK